MNKLNENNHAVKIKFWGTRGSIPSPGKYFIKYGGNTPCVEIRCGKTILILDAGSGLRELGGSLLHEFGAESGEFNIILSHTHWDHIQGFPFFNMAYLPQNKIRFYGGNGVSNLEKLIFGQMDREYFPVSLYELSSEITFHALTENPFYIDDVKIYYTHQIHPSLSLGFRIEYKNRVIVYATDTEISNDPEIAAVNEKNINTLFKNADVLISDCQYTSEEYENKAGWGHTSIDKMIEAAEKNNVKNMFAFHHDPLRTDEQLDIMLSDAAEKIKGSMKLFGAKEKSTVYL